MHRWADCCIENTVMITFETWSFWNNSSKKKSNLNFGGKYSRFLIESACSVMKPTMPCHWSQTAHLHSNQLCALLMIWRPPLITNWQNWHSTTIQHWEVCKTGSLPVSSFMAFELLGLQVCTLCTVIGCFVWLIAHDIKTLTFLAWQKTRRPYRDSTCPAQTTEEPFGGRKQKHIGCPKETFIYALWF